MLRCKIVRNYFKPFFFWRAQGGQADKMKMKWIYVQVYLSLINSQRTDSYLIISFRILFSHFL